MFEILILFISGYLAAVVSGIVGFGGGILLLPLLTYSMDIKTAIPLITIAQIIGNASRFWFNRKELVWKPVQFFLLGAIPFAIIGSLLFSYLQAEIIKPGIGILIILLVTIKRLVKPKNEPDRKVMLIGGSFTGIISGIAGTSGPFSALLFSSLKISAAAYIASEAFAALAMHSVKMTIYWQYLDLGKDIAIYGITIGIAMILGSYTGKKLIGKIKREYFQIIVEVCLVLVGIQMVVM